MVDGPLVERANILRSQLLNLSNQKKGGSTPAGINLKKARSTAPQWPPISG
jgi:hypothetical protein